MYTLTEIEHLYPGAAIPPDHLAEGVVSSWNNQFVIDLPPGSYNAGRPAAWTQSGGLNTVMFNILGDGRTVYLECTAIGTHSGGVVMTLWAVGHPEENSAGQPWVARSAESSLAGISKALTAGIRYFLEVGSDTSSTAEDFILSATSTPAAPTTLDITLLDLDQVWAVAPNSTNPPGADWSRDPGGTIHFTDHHAEFWIPETFTWARFKGVQFRATFPYEGPQLRVTISGPVSVSILFGGAYSEVRLEFGGAARYDVYTVPGGQYFRISRNHLPYPSITQDTLYLEISANGTDWTSAGSTGVEDDLDATAYSVQYEFNGNIDLLDIHGITVTPLVAPPSGGGGSTTPDPTPPVWDPPEAPDPFDPNALMDEGDKGESTLLDLVRAFSSAVRRAVRITGASTIEMVDPTVPVPAGWTDADAADMYVSAGRTAGAETKVLSIRAGDVILTATAQWVADDVRAPCSTWRIPDKLPLYGLPAAPVQRVAYTFSPTGFTAVMDFHYRSVPLEIRQGVA